MVSAASKAPVHTVTPVPSVSLANVDVSLAGSNKAKALAGSATTESNDDKSRHVQAEVVAANQLRIDFAILRVAAITALAIGLVLLVVVSGMNQGVRLTSFVSSDKTDVERKQLLDKYKSWFGNITSIVNKVLDTALGLAVAVAMLRLAAKWTVGRNDNALTGVGPSLLLALLSFLVCNGPTSVYVQVVPGALHVRMVENDLAVGQRADDQATYANGSLITPWDPTFRENATNNSVLNTALRTQLIPFRNVRPRCVGAPDFINPPTAMFSYPAANWIADAFPTALAPTQTFPLYPTPQ